MIQSRTTEWRLEESDYKVPPIYGRRSPMYWAMRHNKKLIIEIFLASAHPSDFHDRDEIAAVERYSSGLIG